MTDYHFHRPERMFTDRAELLEIIGGGWNSLRSRRKSAARAPA